MTSISRTATFPLAAHAVCAAAGVRDGLRAAQFYIRDLANADRFGKGEPTTVESMPVPLVRARSLNQPISQFDRGAGVAESEQVSEVL